MNYVAALAIATCNHYAQINWGWLNFGVFPVSDQFYTHDILLRNITSLLVLSAFHLQHKRNRYEFFRAQATIARPMISGMIGTTALPSPLSLSTRRGIP